MDPRARANQNRRTGIAVGAVALAMIGAAYAAVPLYAAFCRATGYGGTPKVALAATTEKGARTLTVRFDANIGPGLDWTLEPEVASIRVRTGETATVYFRATSRADRESPANAVYNVTPDVAGSWFDKIACFCFNEQHLGARESAEWPVVFFLDPALEQDRTMDGVDTITLSYTLYAPTRAEKPVALAPNASQPPPRL